MMGYQFQQLSDPQIVKNFSLFNSIQFLARHECDLLQFLISRKGKVLGVIHFNLVDEKALSPWKASFGGFELLSELPDSILRNFVTWVVGQVIKKNIREIQITFPPDFYNPDVHEPIANILQSCQFIHCRETGHHLEISDSPFSQHITRFEANKLERCLKEGFNVGKGAGAFPMEAYEMILQHRKRKNIPIKLDYGEFEKNFRFFSENFHWFGVWKKDRLAAASVGIRVKEDILYHFFPGHDNKFDAWSPMVLLLSEIYSYCKMQNIKYLDLGISSVDGFINQGLFQFKKNLGAKTYNQSKFRWIAG